MSAPSGEKCLCCGKSFPRPDVRVFDGWMHLERCYLEHHCGPDIPWPPDHQCAYDGEGREVEVLP